MSKEMYVVVSLNTFKQGPAKGMTLPQLVDCTPTVFEVLADAENERDWAPASNDYADTDARIYRLVEVTE